MYKITQLPRYHSLKNLSRLLIRIQHAFQAGITENHKLNYTNVHFEFPEGLCRKHGKSNCRLLLLQLR